MALALNNLKRVDMPLNKETKPNLTSPPWWVRCDRMSNLSGIQVAWNQSFSSSKAKETSLSDDLPIAGRRQYEFTSFSRWFARNETQTAVFWIWTLVTESIFYDDNVTLHASNSLLTEYFLELGSSVSSLNDILTFVGYLMQKLSL